MKIKNGIIAVNLPDKLEDSDFFLNDPFIVFSNQEFIDHSTYQDFILQMISLYNNSEWETDATGKKRFKFDPNNFQKHKLNKIIADFIGIFNTKDFQKWFRKTHEPFYKNGILGSFFPKYKVTRFLLNLLNLVSRKFFKTKLFNVYTTQVEFSQLSQGASIAPHTDSLTKRMALVFYTPFNKLTEGMIDNWGTTFWKVKPGQKPFRSWLSNHQLKESELNDFYARNEIVASVDYEPNRINGFIKNDLSWHSVKKNEYEQSRVAIVINIHDIASNEEEVILIDEVKNQTLKTI